MGSAFNMGGAGRGTRSILPSRRRGKPPEAEPVAPVAPRAPLTQREMLEDMFAQIAAEIDERKASGGGWETAMPGLAVTQSRACAAKLGMRLAENALRISGRVSPPGVPQPHDPGGAHEGVPGPDPGRDRHAHSGDGATRPPDQDVPRASGVTPTAPGPRPCTPWPRRP